MTFTFGLLLEITGQNQNLNYLGEFVLFSYKIYWALVLINVINLQIKKMFIVINVFLCQKFVKDNII